MIDFFSTLATYLETRMAGFRILKPDELLDVDSDKVIFISGVDEIVNAGDTTFAYLFSITLRQKTETDFLGNVDALLSLLHKKYIGDTMFFVERISLGAENESYVAAFRVKVFLSYFS